jgi:hypothetical protein
MFVCLCVCVCVSNCVSVCLCVYVCVYVCVLVVKRKQFRPSCYLLPHDLTEHSYIKRPTPPWQDRARALREHHPVCVCVCKCVCVYMRDRR